MVEKRLQQGHKLNQSRFSACIDYDVLMRPNEAEEAVHGCMIPARVYYEIRVITWIWLEICQHLKLTLESSGI